MVRLVRHDLRCRSNGLDLFQALEPKSATDSHELFDRTILADMGVAVAAVCCFRPAF